MPDFLGNLRDELYGSCAGADDPHALAGELHGGLRPQSGMTPLACVAVESLNLGHLRCRQDTNSRDEESCLRTAAILGLDLPVIFMLVVHCRHDPGLEVDIPAQV